MFGKHFESMYTGSMVGAGAVSFAVMGYIISHQKPPSFDVELNPKILSVIIGEEEEEIIEVIEKFCKPDEKSRTKAEEGRKLLKLGEYLYHVVNGEQYHRMRTNEERKEYFRTYRQKKRAEKNGKKVESDSSAGKENEPTPEQIYAAYPLKVGKPSAVRAIKNAIKRGSDAGMLLSKTIQFATARKGDMEFCPHPSTWFNQERYNDDPETWKSNNRNGSEEKHSTGMTDKEILEASQG